MEINFVNKILEFIKLAEKYIPSGIKKFKNNIESNKIG